MSSRDLIRVACGLNLLLLASACGPDTTGLSPASPVASGASALALTPGATPPLGTPPARPGSHPGSPAPRPGGGSAPAVSPTPNSLPFPSDPPHSGTMSLTLTMAQTCVRRGQQETGFIHAAGPDGSSRTNAQLSLEAYYEDGTWQNGAWREGALTDDHGNVNDTWVIEATAPFGPADFLAAGSDSRYSGGAAVRFFIVDDLHPCPS
ncbi:MAG: hypothetical protein ACYDAY_03475 [Candidatus Dormibacteria bacterium]